jgi:voltage-dependent potassium channel beta subunit
MEYRRLGRSGLKVSALSFGAWVTFGRQIPPEEASKLMKTAYDHGVNFFDNAEAYAGGHAEVVMGDCLRSLGLERDTFVVSSKVFWGGTKPNQEGLSRKRVMEACHAALRRLQVDYLDLYFCHRPDPATPIEETVRAMDTLIRQGKVLYWGTSEWSAQQIMEAYGVARQYHLTPPTMEQPQYNLLHRHRVEVEFSRLYGEIGLGTTTWSPLASGLLTGKYAKGIPEGSRLSLPDMAWLKERFEGDEGTPKLEQVRKFCNLADELGHKPATLALAWCLKNPNVSTVILGASRVEQLKENFGALEVVRSLGTDAMNQLEEIFPLPSLD